MTFALRVKLFALLALATCLLLVAPKATFAQSCICGLNDSCGSCPSRECSGQRSFVGCCNLCSEALGTDSQGSCWYYTSMCPET
jgi:hypothetical protein